MLSSDMGISAMFGRRERLPNISANYRSCAEAPANPRERHRSARRTVTCELFVVSVFDFAQPKGVLAAMVAGDQTGSTMKNIEPKSRRCEMALAIGMALALSACGGGGGGGGGANVRPTPTPAPAPPPAPTPVPAPAPVPSPTQTDPPFDAQVSLTGADKAHAQGFTGSGVRIGVIDSGIMRNHPALAGRVVKSLYYIDPAINNTAVDDVLGHGTWVAEIAAGKAFDLFAGGVAPGASLVSARIISDSPPPDDGTGQGNEVTSADPLGSINDDLIANNVKITNNSWGGLYWSASATATTQSFHDAYAPFVKTWGGLVVMAAGNSGEANPSDVAALPSRTPDLEVGWLAVVALDTNKPTTLASYSNACGVAKNYCLAAPGDVIVSDKDDTSADTTYLIVKGTSLAAPQVSGAAALVWQAYPYFTNDLVRQTLLGTADDLGAPGVDAVFGYGGLNAGKAVNGPAKFDWGDVSVSVPGSSSWNNPISGTGGLIKQGTGTLALTQPSTFTGLTQVQAGTLVAKSLASSVTIGAQGTLANTHAIGGNVVNSGVIGVNGGDVTVAGDYTQQGSGRLAVSLGSALKVTGKATLAGGDLYVIGKENSYVADSHTVVLSAAGGLTGAFSGYAKASNVTLLNATLGYDANNAWLNVSQVQATSVTGLAYTTASYAAAQRVDAAFGQINNQLGGGASGSAAVGSGFIQAAATLQHTANLQNLQRSLESLSGQLHAASTAMTFEAIDAGTRALSDRFDSLLTAPRAGSWTQNLGYHGGMSRSGYSEVGYDLSGWLAGQDYRIGSNGVAGFALSQSQGLGRLAESADQGRSHAVEGMLYGGVIDGAWYTMGRFGIGSYRENMRRTVELGAQSTGVSSQSGGRYGVAYGESGYRLALGRTAVTPYVNLQYAQIRRDGFNELGGAGFGLKSAAQTAARWQAGLGVRATRGWQFERGGSVQLQTHLLWQQAFGLRGDVFQASFTGLDQWAPLGGIGLARYGGMAGASLDWTLTPRVGFQLGYDQYLGQRQQAKMATASFHWTF
jgi:autotransporter-associated beta strand protein